MKLNSTENIHGIMQGFSTLAANAEDGCRTTLHNGTLHCVYRDSEKRIIYIRKPQNANWESPITIRRAFNIPSLVSFNGALWLIYTDESGQTFFCVWNESNATFVAKSHQDLDIEQSATFAQLNNELYMFYKLHDSNNVYCTRTLNMKSWSKPFLIKKDGIHTVLTYISPVAITYQGLIHLIYKDKQGGFFLIKSDGEHWTSSIPFIGADYHHSPGIAVHNGLLKLAFCNLENAPFPALYQYCYDGNAISPMVASTLLTAGGSPALSTQDGKLIAIYMERATEA